MATTSYASGLGVRTFLHNLFRVKRPCDTDYDAPYAFFAAASASGGGGGNNTNGITSCNSSSGSRATSCVLRLVTGGLSGVLGLGVLVIAGHVANDVAGPAIVSSLVIAAVSSLLSGLCYAEFQTRQSEMSDSVYACFYQSVGELPAFVIGWCMLLQHAVGLAVAGRALSTLADYLTGHRVRDFWMERLADQGQGHNRSTMFPLLDNHPDFVAGLLVAVTSLLFSVGHRWGRRLETILVTATVCVATMFVVVGARHTDDDWTTTATTSTSTNSEFLANESSGLLSGAAICTFSFSAHYSMDFKVKANRRPERNIPLAIGITLTTCFVLYFAVSTVLTLVTHRRKLDSDVPLVQVFELLGITWAVYVTAVGEGFCLVLTLFSLSYALYSSVMALGNDGLLFRCVVTGRRRSSARSNNVTSPSSSSSSSSSSSCVPSLIFGAVSALLSTTFPLSSLLHLIALPPLVINTLVCNCVLYQRYQPDNIWQYEPLKLISSSSTTTSTTATSTSSPSSLPSSPSSPPPPPPPPEVACKFRINKQAVFPLVKQTSLTLTTDSDNDQCWPSTMTSPTADVPLLDIPITSSVLVSSGTDQYDRGISDSDTDIDAIVAEYKEKIRVATTDSRSSFDSTAMATAAMMSDGSRGGGPSGRRRLPTQVTGRRVLIAVIILYAGLFLLAVSLVLGSEALERGNLIVMLELCLILAVIVAILVVIVRQPQNRSPPSCSSSSSSSRVFQVPFMPWIPTIAIFINLCLFANTMQRQWAPFMVWMTIGSGIYCIYGMWNSTAARQANHSRRRAEKIKLQPLPTQPFLSSVLPIHNRPIGVNSSRVTQVDTIFISR